jgi:hypothetical protein
LELFEAIRMEIHDAREALKHLAQSGNLPPVFAFLLRKIAHV